jgi:RNA polymerase sigma factor (sigma-70 family)
LSTNRSSLEIGSLLRTICAADPTGQSDAQLLQQFVTYKVETAFAALVRRHGPMVYGVCRRVLANAHEAEDAYQATFIVLLRKAHALTSCGTLAEWLHGVARRIALKARVSAARRRARERAAARPAVTAPEPRNDLGAVLDEEVGRLPLKYRLPIVLCDLEGATRRDAAEQLGWKDGTVAGRLARARVLLAKRLLRSARITAGAMAVALGDTIAQTDVFAATCPMPHPLLMGTSVSAAASSSALALAKQEIRSMLWNQCKRVAAVCLLAFGAIGVAGWTINALADGSPPQKPAEQAAKLALSASQTPEKRKPTEREKALIEAAQIQYEARWKEFVAGKTTADFLLPWSGKWLEATLRVCDQTSEKVDACKAHLERMKAAEEINKAKFDQGSIAVTQYEQCVYYRIEAEIMLDDLRRRK